MNNLSTRDIIENRLRAMFLPTYLEVLDVSENHRGHAGYDGGGSHFEIRITSPQFAHVPRVNIHQKIYALLADMLSNEVKNNRIHALQITLI